MDKIKKLLKKIPKHDRLLIEKVLQKLFKNELESLNIQKLKGYSHIYRIKVGNYRIIYYRKEQEIILKAIKQRNEATYNEF